MDTDSNYIIKNQRIIMDNLSSLFKAKCILTANFGEHNQSFLTAILEIDSKNNKILIDCAPNEALNNQILSSSKTIFRTQLDGIKVSFSGKGLKKGQKGVAKYFEMPIPDAMFWMQRRQFYRVKIPLSHSGSYCEITIHHNAGENPMQPTTETIPFKIIDLSITGFALLNPNPDCAHLFHDDKTFTDCKLHLNDGQTDSIAFVIKSVCNIRVNTLLNEQRIGCRFTELTPVFESSIQRYMQFIERQQKNISN
jgi:flagellar brake protein